MSTIVIASLDAAEGRSTVAAALGASLAEAGRSVRLLRIRAEDAAAAEDDARAFAIVPRCTAPASAVSEQDAQAEVSRAAANDVVIIEAPAGAHEALASRLSAKVVLVSARADDQRLSDLDAAAKSLGGALAGVVLTRVPERQLASIDDALRSRGLTCLAALPEDRLLAGPSVREMAEVLHASRLAELGDEDEAVEYVMLGPISSDPGQPYFLQHGSKAVVNRFDKMDLHLAALAAEPACLILTGGQQPSPYLIDRVQGSDLPLTVLLSPQDTVRTIELIDETYGRTRLSGAQKIGRAIELFRRHADLARLPLD
jgi:BioD-like phosphotransacetylase family protein